MGNGWKYYNHAMIPDCAPHEVADLTPLHDGTIWKHAGATPLFARWTSDFDCGYETDWWYVIRNAPFHIEELSAHARKHIRQSLKKCFVSRIAIQDNIDSLYLCYQEAHQRYKEADNKVSYNEFRRGCLNDEKNGIEYWGGFDVSSNRLIGYMTICVNENYVESVSSKYSAEYLKTGVSNAINYTILQYYLNDCKKDYISAGARSINHFTNAQEYKERTFGYRKAYCKLHIVYNPKIRWLIKVLFLFRRILLSFDKIPKIHQINSVLKMEEIRKAQNE